MQTNDRPAGGSFGSSGQTRSSTEGRASGTDPALAVDPAGGATLAWTHDPTRRTPGTRPRCAGASGCPARTSRAPVAGRRAGADRGALARGGRRRDRRRRVGARQRRRPPGAARREAARAGVRRLARGLAARARSCSPPRTATAAGDALVTWAGVRRGDLLRPPLPQRRGRRAVQQAAGRAPARAPSRDFTAPAVALDDEGNGTAVWAVTDHDDAGDVFHVQAAGHDAAAPDVIGIQIGRTRAPRPRRRSASRRRTGGRRSATPGASATTASWRAAPSATSGARGRAVHGRRDGHGRGRQRRRRDARVVVGPAPARGASARRWTRAGARLRPAASWCSRGSRSGAAAGQRRPPPLQRRALPGAAHDRAARAARPRPDRRRGRAARSPAPLPRRARSSRCGSPRRGASARCCATGCAPPRRPACAGSACRSGRTRPQARAPRAGAGRGTPARRRGRGRAPARPPQRRARRASRAAR